MTKKIMSVFKTLQGLLLPVVYAMLLIVLLYEFSAILLYGIESNSAIYIVIAVVGYITISIVFSACIYWQVFDKSYDEELHLIRGDLSGTLTKSEFNKKFEEIEKKIDKLIEQEK